MAIFKKEMAVMYSCSSACLFGRDPTEYSIFKFLKGELVWNQSILV